MAELLLMRMDEAEEHASEAVAMLGGSGDTAALGQARAGLAFQRAMRMRDGAVEQLQDALAMGDASGPAAIDDSPLAAAGLLAMYAGDLEGARDRLERAYERAQRAGGEGVAAGLLFPLAECAARAGRAPRAIELAERGLEISLHAGQRLERSVLLYPLALGRAQLGEDAAAVAAASEGMTIAEAAGHRWASAQNGWALGLAHLGAGRPDEAAAVLRTVAESLPESLHPGIVPVHLDAIEALLATGREAAAQDVAAVLGPWAGEDEVAPISWLRCCAGHAFGMLAAAAGDADVAARRLEQAARGFGALGFPVLAGRARTALGAVLRRSRRMRAARAELMRAAAALDAAGAPPWAAQARAELGRIGGRAPSRDDLTPAEQRVAELVAAGLTNREVASRLFLSAKTVDSNLQRIYRKLGVRSRTELAVKLSGQEGAK
jgi:DNA-binding CsgD family transcriptional regulator